MLENGNLIGAFSAVESKPDADASGTPGLKPLIASVYYSLLKIEEENEEAY